MLVHFQVPNEEWDALNKYKVNVRCKGISFLVDISFLVWAHDHLIKIINFHFLIPSIKLPIPRSALKVHEHLSTIIKLSIPRFSNKIANSSHGPESAPAVHKSRNRCSKFPSSLIPQQNKATRIVMILCWCLNTCTMCEPNYDLLLVKNKGSGLWSAWILFVKLTWPDIMSYRPSSWRGCRFSSWWGTWAAWSGPGTGGKDLLTILLWWPRWWKPWQGRSLGTRSRGRLLARTKDSRGRSHRLRERRAPALHLLGSPINLQTEIWKFMNINIMNSCF